MEPGFDEAVASLCTKFHFQSRTTDPGDCGLRVGNRKVYAAYVNGVSIFALMSEPGCANLIRHDSGSAGFRTLREAKKWGVEFARKFGAKNWNWGGKNPPTPEEHLRRLNDPRRTPVRGAAPYVN